MPIHGVNTVCIETETDRFYLDPERRYTLLCRELVDPISNRCNGRVVFSDHEEVLPGLWLARMINCEFYQGDRLCDGSRITVEELVLDSVPDSLFSLQLGSGTTVNDIRHLKPTSDGIPFISYQIPAAPEDLELAIKSALDRAPSHYVRSRQGVWWRWVVLATIALFGACIFLSHSRKR